MASACSSASKYQESLLLWIEYVIGKSEYHFVLIPVYCGCNLLANLKDRFFILFFVIVITHISNVCLQFCPKLQDKHCKSIMMTVTMTMIMSGKIVSRDWESRPFFEEISWDRKTRIYILCCTTYFHFYCHLYFFHQIIWYVQSNYFCTSLTQINLSSIMKQYNSSYPVSLKGVHV